MSCGVDDGLPGVSARAPAGRLRGESPHPSAVAAKAATRMLALTLIETSIYARAPRRAFSTFVRRPSLSERRVQILIANLAVLDRASPHERLSDVARFFQRPARRRIVRERDGEHSNEAEGRERMRGHEANRGRRNSLPPIVFADPVAELRADAIDVRPDGERDATDRGAPDVDRVAGQVIREHVLDVLCPARLGIRMWKPVAQVYP